MDDLWHRLTAWGNKVGAGSLKLRKPATDEDIALAEGTMDLEFPPDYREHLLWHDGQAAEPDFPWMPGCHPLQPLVAVVARWQEERAAGGAGRIPIAGAPYWDADNAYLVSGRLVLVTGEDEIVLGDSFRDAVERYVLLCERGHLRWDPRQRAVVPAEAGR